MRASRLLQILLLLQNRGRMTSAALARELEVAQRTILRDVDALTEAGLPVVVHHGQRGGIELGFNYRTRLTGLDADEAEALGVLIAMPAPAVAELGLADPARRAARKLVEAFPDKVRERVGRAMLRFRAASGDGAHEHDPRVPALAAAIRERRIVRLQAHQSGEREVHPVSLTWSPAGWALGDDRAPAEPIPIARWGDINVSARTFAPAPGE